MLECGSEVRFVVVSRGGAEGAERDSAQMLRYPASLASQTRGLLAPQLRGARELKLGEVKKLINGAS